LLTRRELQPLRRLASAAGEIERTADPARRLPERPASRMQRDDVADLPRPPAGDEIDQLTGVLNRMLASLEVARASERRFLADASHELRTPVTTLLGNVEFLVRHGGDADLVAELKRDATRLARVVDDLLVLERAGTTIGEPVAVDLAQLVEEVVRRYAADHARLQLERLDGVAIRGDKDALARLLENLIDNALVHGPQGGRVSVNVRRDGDHARLTVSDEGPGPDPRYGQQLFERFWRAPEAAGRPGSGLGLSIVAAIAERHGARITVKGSTFAFDVPVMTEHALNH
jgi:two-component system OmpR family sensor kinase